MLSSHQALVNVQVAGATQHLLAKKFKASQAQLVSARAHAADQTRKLNQLQARMAHDARRRKGPRALHASLGLECEYRRRMQKLIRAMCRSVSYWVRACYKANAPEVKELAEDALPARALRAAIRRLSRRWQRQFTTAAEELARWFARASRRRSVSQLKDILKRGGWGVEFKLTPAQRDVLAAVVEENVSLIRSIPSQYFTQVEGLVMRSVAAGRDLAPLTRELQRRFRVTNRRAQLIARDQNNKTHAQLTRVNQLELGMTKAIWRHSNAGKKPRPEHVRMDGQEYDVRRGMWDPKERQWILPGTLINCRCFSTLVIPGFAAS